MKEESRLYSKVVSYMEAVGRGDVEIQLEGTGGDPSHGGLEPFGQITFNLHCVNIKFGK